jgi:hypothetical protein
VAGCGGVKVSGAAYGCGLLGFGVDRSASISESRSRASLSGRKRRNMNWIERLSVRAKHWQIFSMFLGMFVVTEAATFGSLVAPAKSPEEATVTMLLTAALTALWMLCFLSWLWAVGSFLTTVVQPALRFRTRFLLFSVIYSSVYAFGAGMIFQSLNTTLIGVVIPLRLFAMYCIFYCLVFVAKNLVMAESGKRATFYDYAGPFFLLWFFPIDVWFIQPRINRLYAEKRHAGAAPGATTI